MTVKESTRENQKRISIFPMLRFYIKIIERIEIRTGSGKFFDIIKLRHESVPLLKTKELKQFWWLVAAIKVKICFSCA